MPTFRHAWILWLVGMLLLVGAGCASSGTGDGLAEPSEPLPSWIVEITPGANAAFSPVSGISVRYELTAPDTEVRLIVDGVDVTAGSEAGPGLLRYEADAVGIVELDAGVHTAEAQLVARQTTGVDTVVVDSYVWAFRIA